MSGDIYIDMYSDDDLASVVEEAEIVIAYRLSPQRPRAITNTRDTTCASACSSVSSISTGARLLQPRLTSLPSNSGSTTPTSVSFSVPGYDDNLSEAARRCQEWVQLSRDKDSVSSRPYHPTQVERRSKAPEFTLATTTNKPLEAPDLQQQSTRCSSLMHSGYGKEQLLQGNGNQEGPALVFDESVGGWGRMPSTRVKPTIVQTTQNSISTTALATPNRPHTLQIPTTLTDNRRDSHLSIISGITVEDKEQTQLDRLRAERAQEKVVEEQELRQRNKKKPPLRLLSLDGGGIRGYTLILMLEELMHQCFVSTHGRAPDARKGERPPKPCEVFDLIGGSGIGGIIAIFLGRLRLSVAELKETYPSMMQSMLQHEKRMLRIPNKSTMFKSDKLVTALRDIIGQKGEDATAAGLAIDPFDTDDEPLTDGLADCNTPHSASHYSHLKSPLTPGPNWPSSAGYFGDSKDDSEDENSLHRRNSMDDDLGSGNLKNMSNGGKKGRRPLFGGFSKKKSLNDLKAVSPNSSNLPPVPKVHARYADSSKLTEEGSPDEILYDTRAGRCRTFVTAVLKGSFFDQRPALLRTYNSPAEALLEPKCAIWQACAATTAEQMVFKPVQIGQHIFHDEGPSSYNPALIVLKEASEDLWKGREIGCFISIGTGKAGVGGPSAQADGPDWWEGIGIGGGAFATAKRRLAQKLAACEATHQALKDTSLKQYGMVKDDYFRFNVDLGWAASEVNELEVLADLNTITKRYMEKAEVHESIKECGRRLGSIGKIRERMAEALLAKPASIVQEPHNIYYDPFHFKAELPAPLEEPRAPPAPISISATEYMELEATSCPNRALFPQRPDPRKMPSKRETFYIVSELPLLVVPSKEEERASVNGIVLPSVPSSQVQVL